MDRYGRALAHLFMADGIWVQGEMLKNGMDAYTGYTAMTMNNQSYVVRLIAIQHSANNGYHSLMLTPQSKYQNLPDSLQHASYSLDKITDQEATAIKGRKIKIIRARSGDTVDGLSSQMAFLYI